jgi:hypothetical protein
MKKFVILLIAGLALAACQSGVPVNDQPGEEIEKQKFQQADAAAAVIDWVDFIQFDGKHYVAADFAVISDKRKIGGKVGEVEFKVADNINSTNYKVKNGDAAFWEQGTELFKVKDMPDFLAVPDNLEVNGYRLYLAEQGEPDFPHHFKDVNLEKVKAIEIYSGEQEPQLLNRLTQKEKEEFKAMLMQDSAPEVSQRETNPQDPEIYQMIFYTDAPFAHAFYLYKEGGQWLWYPWDKKFLPEAIENYINP